MKDSAIILISKSDKERGYGEVIACKGDLRCGAKDYLMCAFEWEQQITSQIDVHDMPIAEDFAGVQTGLWIWEGLIDYICGSYHEGSCDCGPSFECDEVRPATAKDLKDFGLLIDES